MWPARLLLVPLIAWGPFGLPSPPVFGQERESGPVISARQLQDNLAAKKFTGRRMDLVFSKAGLQEVVAALEKAGGIPLKLDPSIDDPVTYRMLNTPWDEALAAVLADNGLHAMLDLEGTGFKIGRGDMVVLAFPKKAQATLVLFLYNNLIPIAAGIAVLAAGAAGLWMLRRRRSRRPKAAKKPLLPPEGVEKLKNRLIRAMADDKLYRDEKMTLQSLAETLGVSAHQLSWVINEEFRVSFPTLLNGYRVKEVQSRLADPASNGSSILETAMEAGFNTKASFNRAFKLHTGMTPSEYKKSLSG